MTKLKSAEKIEFWPTERLKAYEYNARTHSDEQIEQIANSIKEFGFVNPILVDKNDEIIAGHGRLIAAEKLQLPSVPVIVLQYLTPAQKRAYVIADNKLALNAGWNEELLAQELAALEAEGFDLGLIGFSDEELAELWPEESNENGAEDELPETPVNPVSVLGDVWLLGNHRLMCGDSTSADAVAKLLAGAKPNLMVTDPPYGVQYDPSWREGADLGVGSRSKGKVLNDDKADWTETWALFPGNIAYVWHGGLHSTTVAQNLESCGFKMRAQIIWAKQHFVLSRGDYHWQHEPCWYAVRDKGDWQGDRKQTTIWEIKNNNAFGNSETEETFGHGTQKPVECMRRPIENNSKKGDAIYEPFSGSGTTIIAAEQASRRCFAMELSPAYVDMAILRWQKFTGKEAFNEKSGKNFNVLAER